MADQPEIANGIGGLKIIGAGFGRTGTLSLKIALEELGFDPCYHMAELLKRPTDLPQWEAATRGDTVEWHTIFDGYRATVDWPACTFYKELMNAYPDAKVLLSTRDSIGWYESVYNTLYQMQRAPTLLPMFLSLLAILKIHAARVGELSKHLIWYGTFGGHFDDRDYAITVFKQHNEEVEEYVPSDRLLVYNVQEGWEPLCRFLGVEVPVDKPFPHSNERSNFIVTRMARQQVRQIGRILAVVGALLIVLSCVFYLRRRNRSQQ